MGDHGRKAEGGPRGPVLRVVGEDDAGRRLDAILRSWLGVAGGAVQKKLRKGQVRVDGKRVRSSGARPALGATIEVWAVARAPRRRPGRGAAASEATRGPRPQAIFRDADLLILNKPSGEALYAGSGHAVGFLERVVAWLAGESEERDAGTSSAPEPGRAFRPQFAHRLDRDTSGCCVLCLGGLALRGVHAAFRERRVEKVYTALVQGVPSAALTRIDRSLRRRSAPGGDRMEVCGAEAAGAISAATVVHVLATGTLRGEPAALVSLTPETGRRHQLRVHLAAAGHPVAGDPRYGDPTWNRRLREAGGPTRLCLHARSLALPHPRTGALVRAEAPLPPCFRLDGVYGSTSKPSRAKS